MYTQNSALDSDDYFGKKPEGIIETITYTDINIWNIKYAVH